MIDNQWQFREIDSSLFKAFLFAAKELNFTRAAQKAALTQSGVSQKIGRLEAQIGLPLFLRVNKSVSLTEAGQVLLDFIERQQDELENLFEELGQGARALSGVVRYGMPHSCLFTPHFPLLLNARERFPRVSLKVELCANEEVIERLLRRELDFGFITKRSENPSLDHEPFAVEEYALVGKRGERGHCPSSRSLSYELLLISGEINSLHGAVTMLSHGAAWSVVPAHIGDQELERGEVQVFPGTEKKKIKSEVHIVSLKGNRQPARVRAVLDAFNRMKKPPQ